MIDPHNSYPDSSHNLDFMQAFDGTQSEVSAEEQQAVSEGFPDFVTTILEQRPDTRLEQSMITLTATSRVSLSKPELREPGGRWIATPSNTKKQEASTETSITLVFMDAAGNEREQFIYRKSQDGIVRREDWPDQFLEEQQLSEHGIEQPTFQPEPGTPATSEQLLGYLAARGEAVPNEQFAEEMGFNNQPISQAEFDGLKAFLTASDIEPPRSR